MRRASGYGRPARHVAQEEIEISPLFGHKQEEGEDDAVAAVNADIERLGALPLTQLAGEVMIKGFGPGGPGEPGRPGTIEAPAVDGHRVGVAELVQALSRSSSGRGVTAEQTLRLGALIAEGVQALEHASLVRVSWRGGLENYLATRLGRDAVQRGAVERILGGDRT